MRLFLLACSFAFLFISLNIQAQQVYDVQSVPNPQEVNGTYVSDPDNILQETTRQQINAQLSALKANTTDEIAVVILPSIGDAIEPKEFATNLFERFGIGQKGKDNGLLILMVMDKRRVEFETGYGIEGQLPDLVCKHIQMEYMVPRFKEGNYDQGLLDGLDATVKILTSPEFAEEFAGQTEGSDADFGNFAIIILGIILGILILIIFFVKQQKGDFIKGRVPNTNQEAGTVVPISKGSWLAVYALIPALILVSLYLVKETTFPMWFWAIYGFIVVALSERRIRSGKQHQSNFTNDNYYEAYNNFSKHVKTQQWLAWFFPLPFLFLYQTDKKKSKALREHARNCKNCNAPAVLIKDESADDEYLKKNQITEEQLESVDYDVWTCNNCHSYEVLAYVNSKSKYTDCPSCHTKAYYLKSDVVITAATYSGSGTGKKTFECLHCKKTKSQQYRIAKLTSSSDSSSGSSFSSSSSSSSSFGGGSSGGGGAGSSW